MTQAIPLTLGYWQHTQSLFRIAVKAYERFDTQVAPDQLAQANGSDALVAVVFSAASLETFANECATLAQLDVKVQGGKPQSVANLAVILDEAEGMRASPEMKYLLLWQIFTGKLFDRGVQPFQDFHALMKLRNWLVHNKPDGLDPDPNKLPKAIRELEHKGVLAPVPAAKKATEVSPMVRLYTRGVAHWRAVHRRSLSKKLSAFFHSHRSKAPPRCGTNSIRNS